MVDFAKFRINRQKCKCSYVYRCPHCGKETAYVTRMPAHLLFCSDGLGRSTRGCVGFVQELVRVKLPVLEERVVR